MLICCASALLMVVIGALDCGDTLLRTLNDILQVAKNKHSVELVMEPFSTTSLLLDSFNVMAPFSNQKGVKLKLARNSELDKNAAHQGGQHQLQQQSQLQQIHLHLQPTDEAASMANYVVGDQTRIVQTLQNLVNNAM